jgi:opacity protein-like surface antigen
MAYVKAGYAGADVEFRAFDFVGNVNYQDGLWHHGYALGAGVEYALMTGVRLGLDYTFVDLAAETMKGVNTLGGFEHYKTDADIHSVTARLNFQLGRQERAIERYEPLK